MANTATPQDESWLRRHTRIVRHRPHFSTAAAVFLVLLVTTLGAGIDLARGMLYAFDASAVIFLAGDGAAKVTGHTLAVDDGYLAQ